MFICIDIACVCLVTDVQKHLNIPVWAQLVLGTFAPGDFELFWGISITSCLMIIRDHFFFFTHTLLVCTHTFMVVYIIMKSIAKPLLIADLVSFKR